MSRERCILIKTTGPVAAAQMAGVLRIEGLDAEDDGSHVLVYVDHNQRPKHVRQAALHHVREADLSDEVIDHPTIRSWSAKKSRYVDPRDPEDRALLAEPWDAVGIDPADARWAVRVLPRTIFDRAEVGGIVRKISRPLIAARADYYELGVLDENEGQALARKLRSDSVVREATVRRLGWFERLRIRQRLDGTYASAQKPPG